MIIEFRLQPSSGFDADLFCLVSLFPSVPRQAVLDNVVFYLAFHWSASLLASQAVGRVIALLFNYSIARRAVFMSNENHKAPPSRVRRIGHRWRHRVVLDHSVLGRPFLDPASFRRKYWRK